MTYKLAPQADLCYNTSINIVMPERCVNIPWRDEREVMLPSMNDIIPQKQCTNPDCQKWFPATTDFFYSNSRSGLRSVCKQCHNKQGKTYYAEHIEQQQQYRDQHYDQRKITNARYYEENREQLKNSQRLYNTNNRHKRKLYTEAHVEDAALYRQQNRERIAAQKRKYHQTDRGRIAQRTSTHNHNARKRKAEGTHTLAQLQDQLKRQGYRCYYCQSRIGSGRNAYHADHVVPLSRGGANDISNLVIACPKCNISKNNKLPHEFFKGGRLL